MGRLVALLVLCSAVVACGDDDGPRGNRDGGTGDGLGSGSVDAAACVGQSMTLGDGTVASCAYDVGLSFEPGQINIAAEVGGNRIPICHTERESGCTGDGWYWNNSHQVTLCDGICANVMGGGANVQIVLETGCASDSCGSGACGSNGTSTCTHQTASTCCSGRCDGDSCGGGLWAPCTNGNGCFEGQCQGGFCRCPPGDLQCGASCFDPTTSAAHCGNCDTTCSGGMVCEQSACICPTDLDDCSGTCKNLVDDPLNCGICDHMCRADMMCSLGNCRCPGAQMDCNGACIDTTTSMSHCGACNNACDAGTEVCTPNGGGGASCTCKAGLFDCGGNGTCEDRMTDENNCGTCGHVCPGNKMCINGDC